MIVRAYQRGQKNKAFYTQQHYQHKYELIESVAAFTGAALIWARWGPSAEREMDTSPHP